MSISFGGLLTIIFVVLKLTHNIDWNWIWVLSPLWIGFAVEMFFVIVVGGILGLNSRRRRYW